MVKKIKFSEWVKTRQKICIIQKGIPGSGKSFTAKQALAQYGGGDPKDHIFSTDDYWIWDILEEKRKSQQPIDEDFYKELEKETYRKRWNPQELRLAHEWNFKRFQEAVNRGITPVICDNTNLTTNEAKPYAKYAASAGYEVIVSDPSSPWWKDHSHMFLDKQKYGTELEDFARFLAGHHQGMSKKYGTSGNEHQVPLDTIRNMIRKWQPYTANELLK